MAAEGNPQEERTFLSQTLQQLTALTLRSPGGTLAICVALACVAIGYSVTCLEFKTNRLDLLSPRSEYNRRWLNYLAEFGSQDDAVILVQGKSPAEIQPVIDDLAAQLKPREKYFSSLFYQRDLTTIKAKALHFLPVEDLQRIERDVTQGAAMLARGPATADPAAALQSLNDQLDRLGTHSPEAAQTLVTGYAQLAGGMLQSVAPQGPPQPTPAAAKLPAELDKLNSEYLTAADGRLGFLLLRLVDNGNGSAVGREAVTELRKELTAARARHPHVWIGLTGMPIIEHDEMASSSVDTTVSTIFSLLAVAVLFAAGYGGLRHAALACAALLLGIAWSFGFVTASVGHLNILSASFGAILIGLGIDFGIHYVASYLRLRERGMSSFDALLRTSEEVGPGVVTGAITTSAAFFTAGVTEFVGVAELGIVAGGGVIFCLLSALIALPPLILLSDRNLPREKLPKILPTAKWLAPFHNSPKLIVTATVLVTLGLAGGLTQLRYDHNLLNLQPRRLESSAIERELFTKLDDSVWFAVSVCDSPEELRRRKDEFAKLESVAKVEEIASLCPGDDPTKCRTIAKIQEAVSAAERSRTPERLDVPRLLQELNRGQELLVAHGLGKSPALFAIAGLKQALAAIPAPQAEQVLVRHARGLHQQITGQLAPLSEICNPMPISTDDLPLELTDRFVGKSQKQLLKIYARGDIWDMDRLQRFVGDLEAVDPLVTGHPVQTFYASRHMQASFMHAGLMAVVAVFGLVYLDFQSLRMTIIAMTPLAFGAVSLFGLIGWLGIPLNAANMIVLPLILGIGVDDGVHLAHEFRRQKGRFRLTDSTALAVLLTSLTTMVSFGTMVLARHQGLQSLGQVLTLGTALCLATSLLSFPSLLIWLTQDREENAADELFTEDGAEQPQTAGPTDETLDAEEPEQPHELKPHFNRRPRRVTGSLLDQLQDKR